MTKRQATGASVGIPPRRMSFDASVGHTDYYGGDKATTVFWNTLSMLFPEGEQFFVSAVRNYRTSPEVWDNEVLAAQISGFIGQEAFHTLAHKSLNAALSEKGYPVAKVDAILNKALGALLKTSPILALYVTAILEHYTATMGAQLLDNAAHNAAVSSEAKKLWLHHAVEEVEHRSVSFDVLKLVAGGNMDTNRVLLFFPVSLIFIAAVATLYSYNLSRVGGWRDIRSIVSLLKLLTQNTGKLRDWFAKDFHPLSA